MAYKGKYSVAKAPKSRISAKKIIIIVLCILLVVIAVAGFLAYRAYNIFNKAVDNIPRAEYAENIDTDTDEPVGYFEPDETEVTETTEAAEATEETAVPTDENGEQDWGKTGKILNILLIGQDSRKGEESKLADAIMLCTVNKEKKTLTMTSFLRDTFLKMPDYMGHECGKNRINVNYALGYKWAGSKGAMEMLDLCIYNNFGVEIDGNVEIDFNVFTNFVDGMNGLDIEMTEEEAAYMDKTLPNGVRYKAGNWHMDGIETLTFVRMRHASNGDSDMKRTVRQKQVLTKMLQKFLLLPADQVDDVVESCLSAVLTDMSSEQIKDYIKEILPLLPSLEIVSNQCPVEGSAHGEIKDIYKDGTDQTAGRWA